MYSAKSSGTWKNSEFSYQKAYKYKSSLLTEHTHWQFQLNWCWSTCETSDRLSGQSLTEVVYFLHEVLQESRHSPNPYLEFLSIHKHVSVVIGNCRWIILVLLISLSSMQPNNGSLALGSGLVETSADFYRTYGYLICGFSPLNEISYICK